MSAKRKPSPELPLPLPAATRAEEAAEAAPGGEDGVAEGSLAWLASMCASPASPALATSAARSPASPLAASPSPAALNTRQPIPSGRLKKKKSGVHAPSRAAGNASSSLGGLEEIERDLPPAPRPRPKKEPLPMKLRALPLSFWQQPNVPAAMSPGAVCPALPPLAGREAIADLTGPRAPSPPESNAGTSGTSGGRRLEYVSAADTDLLFALFRGVEQTEVRPTLARRGRPRKPPAALLPGSDDPCLVSVSADPLLPLLPSPSHNSQQQLVMVSLRPNERSPVTLPSLSVEHNYSQLLADLVIRL